MNYCYEMTFLSNFLPPYLRWMTMSSSVHSWLTTVPWSSPISLPNLNLLCSKVYFWFPVPSPSSMHWLHAHSVILLPNCGRAVQHRLLPPGDPHIARHGVPDGRMGEHRGGEAGQLGGVLKNMPSGRPELYFFRAIPYSSLQYLATHLYWPEFPGLTSIMIKDWLLLNT